MSIKIDQNYAYGHLSLVALFHKENEYDGVIRHGRELEKVDEVDANVLDKIGLAFWHKNNIPMSLYYFTKSASLETQAFRYSNLGLIYERKELGQTLDASDAYLRALSIDPDHEQSLKALSRLSKALSASAHAAKKSGTQILDETEFYHFYVNPFILLGCDANSDIEDYPTKILQKQKKRLVQEIDLEDGQIESLEGYTIDKSRALALCDELLDDNKRRFHWLVFQDWRLCEFLQRGDITLFTYDDNYFPMDLLNALDKPAFLNWLSTAFSRQFDLVLSRALHQHNLATIGALLSGRRYVAQQDEDICFAGTSRFIDRQMEPLRAAEKEAISARPSLSALSKMLVDPANPQALALVLNLLPASHFRSFQNEAVRLLRLIALNCYTKHSDPDLSKELLKLANAFASASVDIKHLIQSDEKQVSEIISKEREHEVRFTQGDEPLQITKEGVRKGSTFIAAPELRGVRWELAITNQKPT